MRSFSHFTHVRATILALAAGALALAPSLSRPAHADTAGVEPEPSMASVAPSDTGAPDGEPNGNGTSGWFRVDTDGLETQFWFGATHSFGSINLASDIYVVGSSAELDIGPSFSLGDVSLTPMIGVAFDFSAQDVTSLIAPQLFTIYDAGPLYFESWIQAFFNSIFSDSGEDTIYTRNFLLYKVASGLAVGPQLELSYRINDGTDADGMMFEADLVSLPIGGRINIGYDDNNTLGIFLGYDTEARDGSDGVAGRFTFVRSW